MAATPDFASYVRCMEEIKRRLNAIDEIMGGRRTTSYKYTNHEFVCLQFRKIFELVVLATLASHRHLFDKLSGRLAKEWRIAEVASIVRKKNPGFYPRPIDRISASTPAIKDEWVDVNSGFLSFSELVTSHGRLGKAMHAQNPYEQDDFFEALSSSFPDWKRKTVRLLNNHCVDFPGKEHILYVGMQNASDGSVHAAFFEKVKQQRP